MKYKKISTPFSFSQYFWGDTCATTYTYDYEKLKQELDRLNSMIDEEMEHEDPETLPNIPIAAIVNHGPQVCIHCKEQFPYAEKSNQPDGSFKCWGCANA